MENRFLKNVISVFSNWKYIALAIIFSLLFYSVNAIIPNFSSFFSSFSFLGFFGGIIYLIKGLIYYPTTIVFHSAITLFLLSILFGILISLITYKTKKFKKADKKSTFLSSIGIFLGVLAPGCTACSLGLLPLLGISAASLSFLPLKGLEISILAILIISFAIFKIGNELEECKIKN